MKYGPQVLIANMAIMLAVSLGLLVFMRNPAEAERQEIERLIAKRSDLQNEVDLLLLDLTSKKKEQQFLGERLNVLRSEVQVAQALSSGQGVRYVLTVTLKQTSYSLDLEKHLKNQMNAQTFDLVVDKLAYDAAKPEDDLFNAFRGIINGSLGSWKLTVNSKRIAILPAVEK